MADLPPSYQDAITPQEWVDLVAPYIVAVRDLRTLCAVNRRFYGLFAPRLWSDPLVTVRQLGLEPANDLDWYFRFVFKHCHTVRLETRALVRSMDFRYFAKKTYNFFSDDRQKSLSGSVRELPCIFPHLRCILIDGHTEIQPPFLIQGGELALRASPETSIFERPYILSLAHCDAQLPARFFMTDYLRDLVYLDVSNLPGSMRPMLTAASSSPMPHLRVLKARNREMDDMTIKLIFDAFKHRLWSLDVRGNRFTNQGLGFFQQWGFASLPLRSDERFDTEGKLTYPEPRGSDTYGPFKFITESEWSGTFSHPDRYLADAPAYTAEYHEHDDQAKQGTRSDGLQRVRWDAIDNIKRLVAGDLSAKAPEQQEDVLLLDVCKAPVGITHLHLANNNITCFGVERLLRESTGQLELLDCGDVAFPLPFLDRSWNEVTKLYGMLGTAHVFRPLFSSNLRVLRVHHSLVTQVPTLESVGLSSMARLWIAEMDLGKRSRMAFPQAFVPDMNPRLTSLTLTHIPRRSAGPVIDMLLGILTALAKQEGDIQKSQPEKYSRRNPKFLLGMKHVKLEFEPDPLDDPAGMSVAEDLDAGGLMNMDDGEGFSFFEEESQRRPSVASSKKSSVASASTQPGTSGPRQLAHYPLPRSQGEFVSYSGQWGSGHFTQRVWVGSGIPGPHPAVNEYMRMLGNVALRRDIGPAMPAHVLAGVPAGECLYYAAWHAMVMPAPAPAPPERKDLAGMRDVVQVIKQFRVETRERYRHEMEQARAEGRRVRLGVEAHGFWTGRLEVSAPEGAAHYRRQQYWR